MQNYAIMLRLPNYSGCFYHRNFSTTVLRLSACERNEGKADEGVYRLAFLKKGCTCPVHRRYDNLTTYDSKFHMFVRAKPSRTYPQGSPPEVLQKSVQKGKNEEKRLFLWCFIRFFVSLQVRT